MPPIAAIAAMLSRPTVGRITRILATWEPDGRPSSVQCEHYRDGRHTNPAPISTTEGAR